MARYRGGVAPKSGASVRTMRFVLEAPYFDSKPELELFSAVPLAKHRAREYSGHFSKSWDRQNLGHFRGPRTARISGAFELHAPQEYRAPSRSSHRRNLEHSRGPRTTGISGTFEDPAPPDPRTHSDSSHRSNFEHFRGPRTAEISDTFEVIGHRRDLGH